MPEIVVLALIRLMKNQHYPKDLTDTDLHCISSLDFHNLSLVFCSFCSVPLSLISVYSVPGAYIFCNFV